MLSRELSNAGFRAEFPPLLERRGVGQDVVHATIEVASQAKDGLIDLAVAEAVRRIVHVFNERHPNVEADVDSDEDG